MPVVERSLRVEHVIDGDRNLEPAEFTYGVLEVTTNSSSSTVKTFPTNSAMINSDLFKPGDGVEVIIYNKGEEDFHLAANSGSFIVGETEVPAGGFMVVKLAVTYSSGVMAIFCLPVG